MPYEKHLRNAAAVLALGGDNYSLDYGIPHDFFRAIEITLNHGRPFVLWGASVGPFSSNPEFERFAARRLRETTLICARESLTVEYLASIGVAENVRLCADPAFLLRPDAVPLAGYQRLILDEPCLGLNLSPLVGRYHPSGDPKEWRRLAAACVDALAAVTRMTIVLVPHVVLPGNDDHAFMQEVLGQVGPRSGKIILLDRSYNARQLKGIISRLTCFIGARTHATIAALSSHVPTVSIGYSMKARGINRDLFGHTDWVIEIGKLSAEALADKAAQLLDQATTVRAHLKEVMPSYAEKARSAGAHLRTILEDA